MTDSDLKYITPETFSSLTPKQAKILNKWYDNNNEGASDVADQCGCTRQMVYKTVKSDLGIKYLSWRADQDGFVKIDKNKLIEELQNIAMANYDDCYEVKKNPYFNCDLNEDDFYIGSRDHYHSGGDEDCDDELNSYRGSKSIRAKYDKDFEKDFYKDEFVFYPKNFAKMTRRNRRKVMSAIGRENTKYGTKFTINMKAKMDALQKLMDLAEAMDGGKSEDRNKRSGNSIMSKIRKLSKFTKESEDEQQTH